MASKSFYVVVVDDDLKQINVQGPMSSASWLNRRIIHVREKGRDVRCFSSTKQSIYEVVKNTLSSPSYVGFDYVESNIV